MRECTLVQKFYTFCTLQVSSSSVDCLADPESRSSLPATVHIYCQALRLRNMMTMNSTSMFNLQRSQSGMPWSQLIIGCLGRPRLSPQGTERKQAFELECIGRASPGHKQLVSRAPSSEQSSVWLSKKSLHVHLDQDTMDHRNDMPMV